MERTFNTLFLLSSVDGKISIGNNDKLDFDKDFPSIIGLKEGLNQYYYFEQKTDLFSFNTGRVLAKVGINKAKVSNKKSNVSFIIIDNKPHINRNGIKNLSQKCKKLFLVTNNNKHPVFDFEKDNIEIFFYDKKIDFKDLFIKLKNQYNIDKVTLQSGGTLNSILLREGLIDKLILIIAPVLIGGKDTSTIIDGISLKSIKDLNKLKTLSLRKIKKLKHSYILLEYDINN